MFVYSYIVYFIFCLRLWVYYGMLRGKGWWCVNFGMIMYRG